jgi:hypothetical protein
MPAPLGNLMADVNDLAIVDADSDEFNLRSLFRVAAWGVGAAGALFLAVLAGISGPGPKRAMTAISTLTGDAPAAIIPVSAIRNAAPSKDPQAVRAELESRRLADEIKHLTVDRDHLAQRLTLLEQHLEDVTGTVKRTEAAVAAKSTAAEPAPPKPVAMAQAQPAPQPASAAVPQPVAVAWSGPAPASADAASPWPELPRADRQPVRQVVARLESADEPQEPAQATAAAAAMTPMPLPRPDARSAAEAPANGAAMPAKPQPAQQVASRSVAEPAAARHAYAVDLGGEISVGRLQMLWNAVRSSEPRLKSLRPLASVRRGVNGGRPDIRLVAGPLRSEDDAARLCAVILNSGRYCEPTRFDGQRLR